MKGNIYTTSLSFLQNLTVGNGYTLLTYTQFRNVVLHLRMGIIYIDVGLQLLFH